MKIRAVPTQPHCFAFGGFDIQMHRTLEVLQRFGVDARPLDFWSRDEDFDIVHLWGFEISHLLTARFAKRYGKKIVLTPLFPYRTFRSRVRNLASYVEGRIRPRLELARLVDRFLVVNEQQAASARSFFHVPESKIEIVPTILDDRFFMKADPDKALPDGFAGFFLCAGNICARKNQFKLAQAAIETRTPVMFAGNLTGGEESYGEAFARLIAPYPFLRWERWLDVPQILAAYRVSLGVVLPSFSEEQPTTGLEAAALSKPLLLGDKPYARQKFYRNAMLVEPSSVRDISLGLQALRGNPGTYIPPSQEIQECRSERVGENLIRILGSL